MSKIIVINVSLGETRVAIMENSRLVELYFELPENERSIGNVYLGKVAKVIKGMQAAFINIGQKQDAFLHFSDINPAFLNYPTADPAQQRRPPVRMRRGGYGDVPLRQGQPIIVQITKEPISRKGSRVTTAMSLAGRFLVLLPHDTTIGVSRKINSRQEKHRLKRIGRTICPPGFGMVIRTVSQGKDEATLRGDLDSLVKTWNVIQKKAEKGNPPELLYKDMDMLSSVIRDLFTPDIDKLYVDSKKMFKQIEKYLKEVSAQMLPRLEQYTGKDPIFDKFEVETQISRSLARKVWLKSGGYIFIEHTEALTAIDVNSGRFLGKKDHDANSLKINLEAAREIARQLRLRDIGGIIIIDFIDMVDQKCRHKLQEDFYREMKSDRAQVNIAPLSEFGIIEMTRERVRPSLLYAISEPCSACMGTGRIISKTTIVARIERWLRRLRSEGGDRSLQLVVHPELAEFLTTGYRSLLWRLMLKHWMRIKVIADDSLSFEDFKFLNKTGEEDLTSKFMS
jgi:ribonuclease G